MSAARRANSRDPERDEAHTVAAFLAHWDRAREEGRITGRAANVVTSACRAVLATEGASLEHTSIGELDVDALCERFATVSKGKYKLNTVLTYAGRFRGALESYRDFLAAPEAWSHGGRRRSRPQGAQQSAEAALEEYLYPIREGVLARLVIPRDATAREMARLCDWARTLAGDFEPAPDAP